MIQVGDMVRLADNRCGCSICEDAKRDYNLVIWKKGEEIIIRFHDGSEGKFSTKRTFEVMSSVQENE